MSTKALEEALDYLENNPTADEAQSVSRKAREELLALRSACKAIYPGNGGVNTEKVDKAMELLRRVAGE